MNKIDDISAFAFCTSDYLDELLSDSDLPAGLTDDEQDAILAGRMHLRLVVRELLEGGARQLAQTIDAKPIRKVHGDTWVRDRQAPVARNPTPELYGIFVRLVPGKPSTLVVSLLFKKGSLQKLESALQGCHFTKDDERISSIGVELVSGARFAEIFEKLAAQGKALVDKLPAKAVTSSGDDEAVLAEPSLEPEDDQGGEDT